MSEQLGAYTATELREIVYGKDDDHSNGLLGKMVRVALGEDKFATGRCGDVQEDLNDLALIVDDSKEVDDKTFRALTRPIPLRLIQDVTLEQVEAGLETTV